MLTIPGKSLDVSFLVNKKKKFRTRGGRDGALDAMRRLEENGMGKLVVKKSKGSIKVCSVYVHPSGMHVRVTYISNTT